MTNPTGGNFIQIGGSGVIKGGLYEGTKCSYFLKALDGNNWLIDGAIVLHHCEGNKHVIRYNGPGTLTIKDSTFECAEGHVLLDAPELVAFTHSGSTFKGCEMPV